MFDLFRSSKVICDIAAQRPTQYFSSCDAVVTISDALGNPRPAAKDHLLSVMKVIIAKAGRKPSVLLTAVRAVLAMAIFYRIEQRDVMSAVIGLLFSRVEVDIPDLSSGITRQSPAERMRTTIFNVVTAETKTPGKLEMTLDTKELFEMLSVERRQYLGSEDEEGESIWEVATALPPFDHGGLNLDELERYVAPFEEFCVEVPKHRHDLLRRFYSSDALAELAVRKQRIQKPPT